MNNTNRQGGRDFQSNRGQNRGQARGQGRGTNGRHKNNNNNNNNKKTETKFSGESPDLKDQIFTVNKTDSRDKFRKTCEAIWNQVLKQPQGRLAVGSLKSGEWNDLSEYQPAEPENADNLGYVAKKILDKKVSVFVEMQEDYEQTMHTTFALYWGQCDEAVRDKLRNREDWNNIETANNPIELHNAIKEVTHGYEDSKYPIAVMFDTLKSFVNMKQRDGESISAYHQRFKTQHDIFMTLVGRLNFMEYVSTMDDYDDNDLDAMENCFQQAWDGFTTYTFLNSMQSDYSGKMLEDCSNTYALTREDKFPKTIGAATKAVEKYKNAINVRRTSNKSYQKNGSNSNGHNSRLRGPNNNENQNRNEDNVELQTGFAQQGTRQNGNNAHKSNIRCFACQQFGHYANECPQITRNPQNGSINAQAGEQTDNNNTAQDSNQNGNQNGNGQPRIGRQGAGFLLVQNVNQTIQTPNLLPPNSKKQALKAIVLNQQNKFSDLRQQEMLDSESTDHIYCNSDLLYDIQQVDATLNLQSNGGIISTNWMGKHRQHHFWCWYDDEAISNVISLGKIRESGRFHVSYDFDKGIFTLTNLQTGQETFFHMNEVGLHVTPLNPQAVSMLTTVEANKALYTKRQIAGAEKARALYQVIGYPSLRDFLHLLQTNQIKNCPVTVEDVKICQKIYGPDVYALKGKTVRHKPRVVINDYLDIPRELISAHQGIILFADVMFIDGVPTMVTLSKNVRLITITYIPLRDKDTLLWALDDVSENITCLDLK